MLAQLLLTGLALGAPDYTKKVMVDPDYKPSRTPQQIAKALAPRPRPDRVVYRSVPGAVVYRTEVRRRPSWVWPVVSFGLYYGAHYAWHHGHHRPGYHRHGYHRYHRYYRGHRYRRR